MQDRRQQPAPAASSYSKGRNRFQLQLVGGAQLVSSQVNGQELGAPSTTVKFGKNKLVRASPELLDRLRQQAAARVGARVPDSATTSAPSVQALAAAVGGGRANTLWQPISSGPAATRSTQTVWRREERSAQEQHDKLQKLFTSRPAVHSQAGQPTQHQPTQQIARSVVAAVVTAATKPQGQAPTPPAGPGKACALPACTASRQSKTVSVLSSSGGGQQRVLVYSKGQRGKSLHRTGIKAASKGNLTWQNPAAGAAAASRAADARTGTASQPQEAAMGSQAAAVGRCVAQAAHGSKHGVHQHSSKWNKYVRSVARGAAGSPAAALRPTSTAAPSATPSGRLRLRRACRADGSTTKSGTKLLRLGSSVYKVVRLGRHRTLQRQPTQPAQSPAARGTGVASSAAAPAQRPVTAAASGAAAAVGPGTGGSIKLRRLSRYKLASAAAAAAAAASKMASNRRPSLSSKAASALAAALKAKGGVAKPSSATAHRRQQARAPQRRTVHTSGGGGRLNIQYCPVYCRTGTCDRRGKGCPYKHDSTKRAVCPRWLRGCCPAGSACKLQHQRKAGLMPTCMHYLKGRCTAANCPYLHVRLAPDAPLCKRFMRGFCPAGAACPHKHYTLRMVREEKSLDAAGADGKQPGGAGRGAKRGRGSRYFHADAAGATPPLPAQPGSASVGGGARPASSTQQDEEGQQVQRQPAAKRARQPVASPGNSSAELGEYDRVGANALKPDFLIAVDADYVPL